MLSRRRILGLKYVSEKPCWPGMVWEDGTGSHSRDRGLRASDMLEKFIFESANQPPSFLPESLFPSPRKMPHGRKEVLTGSGKRKKGQDRWGTGRGGVGGPRVAPGSSPALRFELVVDPRGTGFAKSLKLLAYTYGFLRVCYTSPYKKGRGERTQALN